MHGVVESSCLSTHNIAPHISSHDLPYHKTMKIYENFQSMVVSQFLQRIFVIQTWFCNCPQFFSYFTLSLNAAPVYVIQERCWFSQINIFVSTFHIGLIFS